MNPDRKKYNNVIELKLEDQNDPLFEDDWLELQRDLERLINKERDEQKMNYIDNYEPILSCPVIDQSSSCQEIGN